jgi:hypothetical protein
MCVALECDIILTLIAFCCRVCAIAALNEQIAEPCMQAMMVSMCTVSIALQQQQTCITVASASAAQSTAAMLHVVYAILTFLLLQQLSLPSDNTLLLLCVPLLLLYTGC